MKKVFCNTLFWLKTKTITIEADSFSALPWIEIVWLPDNSIRESKQRIRSVFKTYWISLPPKKFLLNMSPSFLKKSWTRFDLALFVSLYLLIGKINKNIDWFVSWCMFFWELWLDWSIKGINWLLPSILWAQKEGRNTFVIPKENEGEVQNCVWLTIYVVSTTKELLEFFIEWKQLKLLSKKKSIINTKNTIDVIQWHSFIKRALKVAIAWQHNVLMIGQPWCWKTLLWMYMKDLLPKLSNKQHNDVVTILSILWEHEKINDLVERPFVVWNSTTTSVWLLWWGYNLLPGLLAKANHWILFLDELAEFNAKTLDVLREPIEKKEVTINRISWSVTYPCSCILVWASNPCKCWFYKSKEKQCTCSLSEIKRYQSKISWPIRDRFDMILEVKKQPFTTTFSWKETIIKNNNIVSAWKIQTKRNNNILNGSVPINTLLKTWNITKKALDFLIVYWETNKTTTRTGHKILKIARTIADLEWSEKVLVKHVSESIQYKCQWLFVDL